MNFTRAITRLPSKTFAKGITTSKLGTPDLTLALKQHEQYCQALETCGLTVTTLDPDPNFPDSTFVEDTAILTKDFAVITNPGAPSRRDETAQLKQIIQQYYDRIYNIEAPGTLDGGDICQADDLFLIGISNRTNETGAEQLRNILENEGYLTRIVDIRKSDSLLHLKSSLAYIGNNTLVLTQELENYKAFINFSHIIVDEKEAYAANCIHINDYLIIPQGYQNIENTMQQSGYKTIALNMSEFQKMDGGLSCLSLRF